MATRYTYTLWNINYACIIVYTRGFIGLVGLVFFKFYPRIVRNEPNLDCFQHNYYIEGATLESLVLCVSWFARKLTHGQTDRQTNRRTDRQTNRVINISFFSPRKKHP